VCKAHGDQCYLNYALGVSMIAALMLGDAARATEYGRESLSGCAALGDTLGLTITLEFLAWIAAAEGDHGRTARLLGAAGQQARVNGGNPTTAGLLAAAHGQYEASARTALGDAPFGAEYRAGAELTLDEAIAYARGDTAPRQPPPTPAAKPPGDELPRLTKREAEIARLIAEGMTNKQIASQLVISQRTAEGHAGNILTKLGFTTRTQIASWVLTQQTAGSPQGRTPMSRRGDAPTE
jgi:DNA-binding CsgD family transcriptional regulator